MSQQEQAQDDARMTFNGKGVDIWASEPDPPDNAATLPQRREEMGRVFDQGEFKKPLTEATRNAVQTQQQAQGVEDPIKEARLLGSGSFTGPREGAGNVALLQEKGFNTAVDTIGMSTNTACSDTNLDAEATQNQPPGTVRKTAQDPSYNAKDNEHLRQNNIEPVRNPAGFQGIGDGTFVNMPGQEQHTQTAAAGGEPDMTLATTLPRLESSISNRAEPATTDHFLATNNAQALPTPQTNPIEKAAFVDQTMYNKKRFNPQPESSAEAAARAPGERPPPRFNPGATALQPSASPRASSSTQPPAASTQPSAASPQPTATQTAEEQHKSHVKKVLNCLLCNSQGPAGGQREATPAARPARSGGQQAGAPASQGRPAGGPSGGRR